MTFRVRVGEGEVSAIQEPAPNSIATFVCAHGAGGNMNDRAILAVSKELRGRGIDMVRFNFPYTERGSGRPDPMPVLQSCIKAVVAEVSSRRLIIGGFFRWVRTQNTTRCNGLHVAKHRISVRQDVATLWLKYGVRPENRFRSG